MKLTKTTVYRLEMERDCGCTAAREYEDGRYTKPLAEGTTTLCEKHSGKSEDAQEILREMILDTLTMQADASGKQYAPLRQDFIEEGDSGGVIATGESVQVVAKAPVQRKGPRRDPLASHHAQVNRPAPKSAAAVAGTGDLNLAGTDIDFGQGEIGAEAAEDPRLSNFLENELDGLAILDQDDAKSQGVSQKDLASGE